MKYSNFFDYLVMETLFVPVVLMVAMFLTILFTVGGAVVDREGNPKFKAACQSANGTAVWNGKNWECIK